MIVLAYTGNHKGDGFRQRAGREIIRLGQIGYTWRNVTHTEIVLSGSQYAATIASASLMDGGVRIKENVKLNPLHWSAIYVRDTERRNADLSAQWFKPRLGLPYDSHGAIGSVLYGFGEDDNSYFCNEACGASMNQFDPHKSPPAGYIAWCLSLDGSYDATKEFFAKPV